jgi:glyceraldehyde 3-phosphate dehydrogenase
MAKRIAINGFGRIGRLTFRNLLNNNDVEVVAINDLTDNKTLAHLLKYDSAHGIFDGSIESTDDSITVNGHKIHASAERDPAKLPWGDLNIDVVLECTGIFRNGPGASKHIEAGAKKVIISAPAKDDSFKTIVLGVNDNELSSDDKLVSNASCTTNCLAPVIKILEDNFGIVQGSLTTTHAYTSDQRIQDAPHSDLRRARACAYNIVPTTTGAANAVAKVIPSVKGKLFAMALRVPIITGSLIELNVIVEKEASVADINATFKKYAEGEMKGVLQYMTDPIVSSDIVRNPHSSIFDSLLTDVNGKFVKIVSWYDNEAGYSARLADLTARV